MTQAQRPKICAGNWKMYKTPVEALAFLQEWSQASAGVAKSVIHSTSAARIIIFPSAFCMSVFADEAQIAFGPQNIFPAREGAYTGENSPVVAKAMGATYVLVGHSERRTLFNDSDDDTAKKVKAAVDFGLTPMLCVGETLSEREAKATNEVLRRQLTVGLAPLVGTSSTFVIAYEPVWAIGTGKVATPEMAEDAHKFIRKTLSETFSSEVAERTSILYGGSVKPDNAVALGQQTNIDGFLVGGASLKVKDFLQIAQAL